MPKVGDYFRIIHDYQFPELTYKTKTYKVLGVDGERFYFIDDSGSELALLWCNDFEEVNPLEVAIMQVLE